MTSVSVGVLNIFNHEIQEWGSYKGRLEQWFQANAITAAEDKSGARRRAILLSSLGETTYRLIQDLALPKDVGTLSYEEVTELFDGHFQRKTCSFAERYKFHSAVQAPSESFSEWSARVRGLAKDCGFPQSSLEDTLRDRFVLGMASGPERDRLFTEPMEGLSLQKALQLAENIRCAREGSRHGGAPGPAALEVHKLAATARGRGAPAGGEPRPRWGPAAPPGSSRSAERCDVCGYVGHLGKKCRFRNAVCKICGKKGHLQRVCENSNTGNQHFLQCCSDDDDVLTG
ncbi:uncharacterized protein LOC125491441 [Plutella xylostella]|uniref:uncharacterized protein LOC125491441 n=1 Tax=Plutella xylostella TaxID=51655 RepID=UPI0020328C3C|nr:uncharacterized protein LOC125491441 [Plutella xylostella]